LRAEKEEEGDYASKGLRVVTIDGPSGAGKSTIAKTLAKRLGWNHLDTGSMYRAVTLALLREKVDLADPESVQAVLDTLDLRLEGGGKVFLGKEEVSQLLRDPDVENLVSAVSALPAVRARMKELQRREALRGPLVAEGRDMGSVVFPDAQYKFFLDASPAERARRRHQDFEAQGLHVPRDKVLAELERRDRLDSTRKDAPLVRTKDMESVDSTHLGIQEIVDRMVARVRAGLPSGEGPQGSSAGGKP